MEVCMEKLKCPNCEGNYMVPNDYAQTVGTVVGGTFGLLARMGAIVSGPVGTLAAVLAGAVTGQKLGEVLDDHVIKRYRCTKCGLELSL
jgi:outer membrane lipoprotein SlyB